MVTLQEKKKTYSTFNVSQWNQNFVQVILGRLFWSIHDKIYKQCKGQNAFSNYVKNYVDAARGINPAIFEGTLNGLNENTLKKFIKRMSLREYENYMDYIPARNFDDIRRELVALREVISNNDITSPHSKWDMAVIGNDDLIFVAKNQINAWQEAGVDIVCKDVPHYSASLFREYVK